jgi:integrase
MAGKEKSGSPGDVLRALGPGKFATIAKRLPNGGSLQARKLADATQFYWRYSHDGKTHREPVGLYDPSAPPRQLGPTSKGFSVAAAVEACRGLAATHKARATTGGLREAKAEALKAFAERKLAEDARRVSNLEALLQTYVSHLAAQGRQSAREVQNLTRLNVVSRWPKIAAKPAAEVTPDEILDMLRALMEAGKGRSANKLRTYLRAAYQCAIDVRTTAAIPVAFKPFQVTINPVAQTKRSAQFDKADKRPLSLTQLQSYWRLIKDLPRLQGAALRLHLLSGGQRIEQLVRLRWSEVRQDSFTIFDAKGRPGSGARAHVLPITPELAKAFSGLERVGDFAISASRGVKPISSTTLAGWARKAAGQEVQGFQLKRVRSGVETALAAQGISREIRGHLQSHGLTGVQAKHYDAHDYLPQKTDALNLLARLLANK